MAITVLRARETTNWYFLRVWIDDTKTLPDGTTPDPAFVMEFRYSTTVPDGMTKSEHVTSLRQLTRKAVLERLDTINEENGTPLAIEGQTL